MREGEKPILEVKLQPYKRLWFLPSQQRLLISATIRYARGKVVAKLEDNQWSTDVPTYDRNYRDDAFEVRDGDGNVVLQVVNFDYTIHMAGAFRCKNGWVNVIAPGYDAQAGNVGAMEIKPPWMVPNTKIKPICDYPSDLHLGECPGIDALHKLLAPPNAPAINAGGEMVCNDKNIGVEKP